MITTNLLQFVQELNTLGPVHVHDTMDTIELLVSKPVDVQQVDDLVCDALFVDPLGRQEGEHEWRISLAKRSQLRSASDMQVVDHLGHQGYVLRPAA